MRFSNKRVQEMVDYGVVIVESDDLTGDEARALAKELLALRELRDALSALRDQVPTPQASVFRDRVVDLLWTHDRRVDRTLGPLPRELLPSSHDRLPPPPDGPSDRARAESGCKPLCGRCQLRGPQSR